MRYYIKYDNDGNAEGYMVYPGENQTMTEVTEEDYYKIRTENGIVDVPEPEPETGGELAELINIMLGVTP